MTKQPNLFVRTSAMLTVGAEVAVVLLAAVVVATVWSHVAVRLAHWAWGLS